MINNFVVCPLIINKNKKILFEIKRGITYNAANQLLKFIANK
jgi:hypothetical protein